MYLLYVCKYLARLWLHILLFAHVVANVIKCAYHLSNKIHPTFSSDEDVDDNDDSQLHVIQLSLLCF